MVLSSLPESTSVYGFLQRPSLVDFPGRLAAVFFTSGCNLSCGFCHNAGLLQRKRNGLSAARLREAIRSFRDRQWVDAAVITGGEPTLCSDLPAIIECFRAEGLSVKLDSNGTSPEILRELLPRVDAVAMDIKCSLDRYKELTGFDQPERIAQSVQLLLDSACDCEFRTTVIETFHSDAEMHAVGTLIRGARRYTLQPFIPRDDLPDPLLRAEPRTTPERLRALQTLMAAYAETVTIKGSME